MKPYFREAGIEIYLGDCLQVFPEISNEGCTTVVSDPPYGMNCDTDSTRFSGGHRESIVRRGIGKVSPKVAGDDHPFDPVPWLHFPEVILWGFNHFAQRLPVGTTLVWIKRLDPAFGSFLSDAELAWMKGGHGVYCRRDLSMMAEAKVRQHPTQKPVSLMLWCLGKTSGEWVLDPYMGSGSTLIAAKELGRQAIGIEIEERYCEIAANRLRQSVMTFESGK